MELVFTYKNEGFKIKCKTLKLNIWRTEITAVDLPDPNTGGPEGPDL